MHALELNDWEIQLFSSDGALLLSEPAAALYLDDKLTFGHDALQASRLNPQSFANQYVNRLGSEPLTHPLGLSKNQADLLYQHLLALNLDREITVLIPSDFTNEKLGIFLGIAKQAGVSIKGFIDAPLAYSLHTPCFDDFPVLDLDLHRTSITQIRVEDSRRTVVDNRLIESVSLSSIIDGWLNVIADEFIQKTRFDPFHFAQTEQQLFNCVTQFLLSKTINDLQVAISYENQDRLVNISEKMLMDKLKSKIQSLELSGIKSLVISPRVLKIPGLYQILQSIVPNIITIDPDQLVQNVSVLVSEMKDNAINRITSGLSSLTVIDQDDVDKVLGNSSLKPATHLLFNNHAYRLDHPNVSEAVLAQDKTLLAGEEVHIDSETYTAISVD